MLAFALSGFVCGLVGASYAFQQAVIYPERLFEVSIDARVPATVAMEALHG